MGKMTIMISDDLEDKFRTEVFMFIGKKNGHVKQGISEAITMWLASQKRKRK